MAASPNSSIGGGSAPTAPAPVQANGDYRHPVSSLRTISDTNPGAFCLPRGLTVQQFTAALIPTGVFCLHRGLMVQQFTAGLIPTGGFFTWDMVGGTTPTTPVQRNESSVVPAFPTAATYRPLPHQCKQCESSFERQDQLWGHMSKHSEKRNKRKRDTQELESSPPIAKGLRIDLNKSPPPSP